MLVFLYSIIWYWKWPFVGLIRLRVLSNAPIECHDFQIALLKNRIEHKIIKYYGLSVTKFNLLNSLNYVY